MALAQAQPSACLHGLSPAWGDLCEEEAKQGAERMAQANPNLLAAFLPVCLLSPTSLP